MLGTPLQSRNKTIIDAVKSQASPAPKKAKVVASAGKMMAFVLWDAKGILIINYLRKSCTINGEYYAKLLKQFAKKNQSKAAWNADCKILHASTVNFYFAAKRFEPLELVYTSFDRNAVCKSVFLTATVLSGKESSKLT